MASAFQREYAVAPELNRCCWYTIIGAILAGVLAVIVTRFVPGAPERNIPFLITVLSLFVAGMFILKGWRLRLDGDGISHGLPLGWDLWSRDDLASGRIRKLRSNTLCDPKRSLWSRYLCLDFLANADRQEVLAEINKHYRLPPPPQVPEKLELRYGFRRSITFEKAGIQLKHGKAMRDLVWSDVQDIHVSRLDPIRRDFVTLVVVLPGEEIELKFNTHNGQKIPTWKGPDAEVICEFLSQSPARDRVFVAIATEAATRPCDAERDLATMKKNVRALYIIMGVFGFLFAVMFVWMSIEKGLFVATLFFTIMAVLHSPILFAYFFIHRLQQIRLAELVDLVAKLKGEPRPPV